MASTDYSDNLHGVSLPAPADSLTSYVECASTPRHYPPPREAKLGPLAMAEAVLQPGSDNDDLYESFEPVEILRVASKEGGVVRAGRCGNQQIHHPSARLTTGFHDVGSQEPIAFRNCLIHR